LFTGRRVQLTQWAAHHRMPASYAGREYVEAGALMSYGSNTTDAFRQSGIYVGRIRDITGGPSGAMRTLSPSAGTFTTPMEQRGGSPHCV
jgi:hypothetical protein